MPALKYTPQEMARIGKEWYEKSIREKVETAENIGKMLVIDIETGEYELDADDMAALHRARAKHPEHLVYQMRIGYPSAYKVGGGWGMPRKEGGMSEHEKHIQQLFTAELQFRLASAVRVATTRKVQPLDLPTEWTHGQHHVRYEELALREDQADYASCFLHRSATFLMAVALKDAIRAIVPDPKTSADSNIRAAYQIARLIRNAFAHASFSPTWSIDPDCRDKVFVIPGVIMLDTTGLHGTAFDWHHYGGPLALFRLCHLVRTQILKDPLAPRKLLPGPRNVIHQQGYLILEEVDEIPQGAVPLEIERLSDGGIPLGGGHVLYPDGAPGSTLLEFAGHVDAEDLALMTQAIEEGCEEVNPVEQEV